MSEGVLDLVREAYDRSTEEYEYDSDSFLRVSSLVPLSNATAHVMPKVRPNRSRHAYNLALPLEGFGAPDFTTVVDLQWTPTVVLLGASELAAEIDVPVNELKRLLQLKDNWDGEGSEAYKSETIERASHLLRTFATEFRRLYRRAIPVPTTGPGAEGGVDLIWRRGNGDLIITVPSDPHESAAFSGRRGEFDRVQGVVSSGGSFARVLGWLADSAA